MSWARVVAAIVVVAFTSLSAADARAQSTSTLHGVVVLPGIPPTPVAGAQLMSPTGAGIVSDANGEFSIPNWPDEIGFGLGLAIVECSNTGVAGLRGPIPLDPSGVTDLGSIVLAGGLPFFNSANYVGIASGQQTALVAWGDRDGDGDADFCTTASVATGTAIHCFVNGGHGEFSPGFSTTVPGGMVRDFYVGAATAQHDGSLLYPSYDGESFAVIEDPESSATPVTIDLGGPAVALQLGQWVSAQFDIVAGIDDPSTGGGAVVHVAGSASCPNPPCATSPDVVFTTPGHISALAVGPIDEDALDDVLVLDRDSGTCTPLLWDAVSASFVASDPLPCPGDPRDARSFRYGDGSPGFLVIGTQPGQGDAGRLLVLRREASGEFTATAFDFGSDLRAIAISHEVLFTTTVAVTSAGDQSVYELTLDGDTGELTLRSPLATDHPNFMLSGVTSADLNGDGFHDILAATGQPMVARWLSVQAPGDGDGDGIDDIAELRHGTDCANPDSDEDAVLDLLDNCPSTPNAQQQDGDGDRVGDACDSDLVNSGSAGALNQPADGTFTKQIIAPIDLGSNGAGFGTFGLDYLSGQAPPNVPMVQWSSTDAVEWWQSWGWQAEDEIDFAAADIDGDGQDEVILSNMTRSTNGLQAVRRNLSGAWEAIADLFPPNPCIDDPSVTCPAGHRVTAGDLDGNGAPEVIVSAITEPTCTDGSSFHIFTLEPTPQLHYESRLWGGFNECGGFDLATADLDGNGSDELILGFAKVSNQVFAFQYDSSWVSAIGFIAPVVVFPFWDSGVRIATGHVNTVNPVDNPNERPQVLVATSSTGGGGSWTVLDPKTIYPAGISWDGFQAQAGSAPAFPEPIVGYGAEGGPLDIAAGNVDGDAFDEVIVTGKRSLGRGTIRVFGFDSKSLPAASWDQRHPMIATHPDSALLPYQRGGVALATLASWPTPGGSYFRHSGASPFHATHPGAGSSVTVEWVRPLAGERAVNTAPTLSPDGGTVYVGTWGALEDAPPYDGKLFALNAQTGAVRWVFNPDEHVPRVSGSFYGTIEGGPTIGTDGTIYIGRGDGRLYAVSPNGDYLWRFQTFDRYVDANGSFCNAANAGCVPADTPEEDPYFPAIGGEILGAPLLDDRGIVYFATMKDNGRLCGSRRSNAVYAVTARDGIVIGGEQRPAGYLVWRYPDLNDGENTVYGVPGGVHSGMRSYTTKFFATPVLSPDGTTLYVASERVSPLVAPCDGPDAVRYTRDDVGLGPQSLTCSTAPLSPMLDVNRGYVIAIDVSTGRPRWMGGSGQEHAFSDTCAEFGAGPERSYTHYLSLTVDANGIIYAGGESNCHGCTEAVPTLSVLRDLRDAHKPEPIWRFADSDPSLTDGLVYSAVSDESDHVFASTGNNGGDGAGGPGGGLAVFRRAHADDPSQPYDGGTGGLGLNALPTPPSPTIVRPTQLGLPPSVGVGGVLPCTIPGGGAGCVFATRGDIRPAEGAPSSIPGSLIRLNADLSTVQWYWLNDRDGVIAEFELGGVPALGATLVTGSGNMLYVGERVCTSTSIVSACTGGQPPTSHVYGLSIE